MISDAEYHCRICHSSGLHPVLSLGTTPLANSLLTEEGVSQPEARFPLDLAICLECSLLQITQTVPPEQMFRDYLYFSSFSDTMLQHARHIALQTMAARSLGPESLVVEIASNDGYLLSNYADAGVPVLGVEPARNVAKAAIARGVPTVTEFFGIDLAAQLQHEGKAADVIHANNVLAHVPDLLGVMAGIRTLLKPGGVAIIEVPYAGDMLQRTEFDTIYHEHLCYFSLNALNELTGRNGLCLQDVERMAIHGGSLRIFVGHEQKPSSAVTRLLEEEESWGVKTLAPYQTFAASVQGVTAALTSLLRSLKAEGKRLAAYGAAAKGSTLLNFAGIDTSLLEFVVDRSTHKQGRFMPGVHLPILPPEHLLKVQPDYVVLLTWNFADEILHQQKEFRRRGGRFIIPLPEVVVV